MTRGFTRLAFASIACMATWAEAMAQEAPAPGAARPFAAPDSAASLPANSASGIGQVTLALLVVLGAVFAVAWVMRRLRDRSRGGNTAIEILGQTALGARERAVLVQVGGTRLLLGVAPGRVSALHVLPADAVLPTSGAPTSPSADDKPTFFSLLQKSLGQRP